jgi:hypothetical protein
VFTRIHLPKRNKRSVGDKTENHGKQIGPPAERGNVE